MIRHPPHMGAAPGDALFTIPAEDRARLRRALIRQLLHHETAVSLVDESREVACLLAVLTDPVQVRP